MKTQVGMKTEKLGKYFFFRFPQCVSIGIFVQQMLLLLLFFLLFFFEFDLRMLLCWFVLYQQIAGNDRLMRCIHDCVFGLGRMS